MTTSLSTSDFSMAARRSSNRMVVVSAMSAPMVLYAFPNIVMLLASNLRERVTRVFRSVGFSNHRAVLAVSMAERIRVNGAKMC